MILFTVFTNTTGHKINSIQARDQASSVYTWVPSAVNHLDLVTKFCLKQASFDLKEKLLLSNLTAEAG